MAAAIFNSSPIERKVCNFAVGVICHSLAKGGRIWRRSGRLEHPSVYLLLFVIIYLYCVFKYVFFNLMGQLQ